MKWKLGLCKGLEARDSNPLTHYDGPEHKIIGTMVIILGIWGPQTDLEPQIEWVCGLFFRYC